MFYDAATVSLLDGGARLQYISRDEQQYLARRVTPPPGIEVASTSFAGFKPYDRRMEVNGEMPSLARGRNAVRKWVQMKDILPLSSLSGTVQREGDLYWLVVRSVRRGKQNCRLDQSVTFWQLNLVMQGTIKTLRPSSQNLTATSTGTVMKRPERCFVESSSLGAQPRSACMLGSRTVGSDEVVDVQALQPCAEVKASTGRDFSKMSRDNGYGYYLLLQSNKWQEACLQVMNLHQTVAGAAISYRNLTMEEFWLSFHCSAKGSGMMHPEDDGVLFGPYDAAQQGFAETFVAQSGRSGAVALVEQFLQVQLLRRAGWLDEYTRVVSLSFATFNPSTWYLNVLDVQFTFGTSGSVTTVAKDQRGVPLRPYVDDSQLLYQVILEVAVTTSNVLFTVLEFPSLLALFRLATGGLDSGVTTAEAVRGVVSVFRVYGYWGLVVWWARIYFDDSVVTALESNRAGRAEGQSGPNDLVQLRAQSEALYDVLHTRTALYLFYQWQLVAFTVAHTVWLFSIFHDYLHLHSVVATLTRSAAKLIDLLLIMLVLIAIFTSFGQIIFGPQVEAYNSFFGAFTNVVLLVVQDFDYQSLDSVNSGIAFAFFWGFTLVVFLVGFNIVIAVVLQEYSDVDQSTKQMGEQSSSKGFLSDLKHSVSHSVRRAGTKAAWKGPVVSKRWHLSSHDVEPDPDEFHAPT